jgi:hypothetical protein
MLTAEENMNTTEIIAEIDSQISKLQAARALLTVTTATSNKRTPGRPKATEPVTRILSAKPTRKPMSAGAREKIAAAQRLRWAKSKKIAKKAA